MASFRKYIELRPDELEAILKETPVALWPLGLLEHHGWHLPVGFDGIKAERMCERIGEKTGGVMLPVMWWGGGGGHDVFKWTFYQSEAAYAAILTETVSKLVEYGFKAIVVLAGHYPWQSTLVKCLPEIQAANPDVLMLWGTEVKICEDTVSIQGDHAAKEETSFGLALFSEFVDMDALTPGRGAEVWIGGEPPPLEKQHPKVCFDPSDPLFSQMGVDAREASAEHGEDGVKRVVDEVTRRILAHIDPEGK
jgi:creatinine amidohydrolase